MIKTKENGNHTLDYTQLELSFDNVSGADFKKVWDSQVNAIYAVIEKEGPDGNHIWELQAPPIPYYLNDEDNRDLDEARTVCAKFHRAILILGAAYDKYAENHPDNEGAEDGFALTYCDEGDSFDATEPGRWSRINEHTLGIDMKHSQMAIEAGPCDIELSAYNYQNYSYYIDTSWLSLIVNGMLKRNITPAMYTYLTENYEQSFWPIDAVWATEDELLSQSLYR